MPHLVLSERATYDLHRLYGFLEDATSPAAKRAVSVIRKELRVLTKFPLLGTVSGDSKQNRRLIIRFGGAAYVVRYIIVADEVIIQTIRHSREAG